jgi:dihydrofolate reductase
MGKLIYSMSVSLDGFVDTPTHSLDWVRIDEELHAVFNEEARGLSAFLYGRRMYELMAGSWPYLEDDPSPAMRDFARIWKPKPKIVFSRSLPAVEWNSRLVRDGAIEEVARLKAQPGFDMDVGGPTTAAPFLRAGLIDEIHTTVHPVVLGAGTPFLPHLEERAEFELLDTRTFDSGVVRLRYRSSAAT